MKHYLKDITSSYCTAIQNHKHGDILITFMYIIIVLRHVLYNSEGYEQSMNRVLYVQWWRLWTVLYNSEVIQCFTIVRLWTVLYSSEVMNSAVQQWGYERCCTIERLWTVLYNSEVMNITVQQWGHKQYVETRELWAYAYTEAEFMNVQFR